MRIGDNLYCINEKVVVIESFNKEIRREITHKKGKVYKIKGYLLDDDVVNKLVIEHGQVPYEAISVYIEAEPSTTPNGYYGFMKDIENKGEHFIKMTNYREHFITENQYRKLKLNQIIKNENNKRN